MNTIFRYVFWYLLIPCFGTFLLFYWMLGKAGGDLFFLLCSSVISVVYNLALAVNLDLKARIYCSITCCLATIISSFCLVECDR